MAYFPRADADDAREMLDTLGLEDPAPLFAGIPDRLRKQASIAIADGFDEPELVRHLRALANKNRHTGDVASFVGAGAYPYPTPAAAAYAMSRGEFLTAYTPYQPEISQGTLMAVYEFQTWVAELAGMPVANASMYDGATALAEAALLGLRARRKARRVCIAATLAPPVRAVVERYLMGQDCEIETIPATPAGMLDPHALADSSEPRIVLVGSPNGWGLFEDIAAIRGALDERDFLVVHTPDPHAWLLVDPPGAQGADVAVAEGQPFGVPVSFGGPLLGLFATRDEFLRQMPGRLCGETVDRDGKRGFVLTLSTREQHIRREKATSNICSNQGVIALLATVSMGVLGPAGLRQRALDAASAARRLAGHLEAHGLKRRHGTPFFNEFVVDVPGDAGAYWEALVAQGVQLGIPLARWDSADRSGLLVCATAHQAESDFARLEAALKAAGAAA